MAGRSNRKPCQRRSACPFDRQRAKSYVNYRQISPQDQGTTFFREAFCCYGTNTSFTTAHAAVQDLFNLGRHLVLAQRYRDLGISAFGEWGRALA